MKAMLLPVLMSDMKFFSLSNAIELKINIGQQFYFRISDHRKHQVTVNYGSLISLQGQVTNFYTVLYGTRTTAGCNYRLITQFS